MQLVNLPFTSNMALVGPARLTQAEFDALPVPAEQREARELIHRLEDVLHEAPDDLRISADTLVPVHRFIDGVYMRELTMPAGSTIVGKRHAQEHFVVMTKGRCVCVTERGQEDLVAPCVFVSPAGEKRALFMHEETTWLTVHRTDHTNLDAIEDDLILARYRIKGAL